MISGIDIEDFKAMQERKGDWIQVYSGVLYYPTDPRADEVHICDIAAALSKICRFAGHCNDFYSVAEHSVHVSYLVPPEDALTALLHDATEAYLIDVPRPLKKALTGYAELELLNWIAIALRFRLDIVMPASVKAADDAMLMAERDQLITNPNWSIPGVVSADREVLCLAPDEAELLFLERYFEILDGN